MNNYQQLWRLACTYQFVLLIIIFTYLGLTPAPEKSVPIVYNDLFMHFAGYCVAAFSITLAFPTIRPLRAAIILIVYSLGIEIAQHFNPPRTFARSDLCANALGTIIGLVLVGAIRQRLKWIDKIFNYSRLAD